jgi:hypothetical protein
MQSNSPVPNFNYSVANGGNSNSSFITVFTTSDPTPNDIQFQIKTRWVNTTTNNEWILISYKSSSNLTTANWIQLGDGNAIKEIGVPSGTSPIDADSNGLINFTSNSSSIQITGNAGGTGAQNINFDLSVPSLLNWTPTLSGSSVAGTATYSSQQGTYRVFAGIVFVQFNVIGSITGASGNVTISGLPIPCNSSAGNCYGSCLETSFSWPSNITSIVLQLQQSNSSMTIFGSGSGTAFGAIQIANTSFNIQGSIFYPI